MNQLITSAFFARACLGGPESADLPPSTLLVDLALCEADAPVTLRVSLDAAVNWAIMMHRRIAADLVEIAGDEERKAIAEIAAALRELSTRLEDALEGRLPAGES